MTTRSSAMWMMLALSFAGSPLVAQAPSAEEILARGRARYRAALESVERYTVIQRILGPRTRSNGFRSSPTATSG